MGLGYIINLFKNHSVTVTGEKGSGKDLLMSNVVAYRNEPYVSNIDYTRGTDLYSPLDLDDLNCGENRYTDFITNNVKTFESHIHENEDVYISDCGVYFPSQYCNELNRDYKYFPSVFCLFRHTHNSRIHTNAQSLNRVWDKLREQSTVFLHCRWAIVLFDKIVIQLVTEYDRVDSCIARIHPCRIHSSLFDSPEVKKQTDLYLDNFFNSHGKVKNHLLIYYMKSNYDTRHFKTLLNVKYLERIKNNED